MGIFDDPNGLTFDERKKWDVPEETRDLLVGILRLAVKDLYTKQSGAIYQDAEAWIKRVGVYEEDYFLSFDNVCLLIDLPPDRVREELFARVNAYHSRNS